MGAREAQCYLANPAVVAASAVAGYICGPEQAPEGEPDRDYTVPAAPPVMGERVPIVEGFPATMHGRLIYVPADNLNTDGIYGKDYTYRDDITPEIMAQVVMENYDPDFARRCASGDILVGGFNFGTGSSREQAATALAAAGIRLVIAGSFSQIFQRNAFNNGFPCLEVPAFVQHLRQVYAAERAEQRTIIPGETLTIDFSTGTLLYRDARFEFAPLGAVPQALVVAGGVEALVAARLSRQ
jgi:homoaconitate hydratase